MCETLATVSLRDSVQDIYDVYEVILPSYSLEPQTLSPLLLCPNLEKVSLSILYGQEAIDNSLMKAMALAWPRLRSFHISSVHRASEWHSSVSLEGLIHFARHCPALGSVSYQFDASLPTTSMHSGDGIRNESLTRLCVGYSHITDPPAVAALLSDVFPNMRLDLRSGALDRDIDSDDEDDTESAENYKHWKEVDQMLEIRKQQRS